MNHTLEATKCKPKLEVTAMKPTRVVSIEETQLKRKLDATGWKPTCLMSIEGTTWKRNMKAAAWKQKLEATRRSIPQRQFYKTQQFTEASPGSY